MPVPVPNPLAHLPVLALIAAGVLATGCGDEIGDSCSVSSDCSPNGDRICDPSSNSPGGYCTILGCDHDTCPEEAVCVRFFATSQTNLICTSDADCTPDETCTLGGFCVPRASEVRYCMRTCGDNGDCRENYECRDEALMVQHGGETVTDPSKDPPSELPSFCAGSPL
jgi:hypothetical protein